MTGTWSIEIQGDDIPPEERNAILSLELAADGTVTGSVDGPGGEEEIANGKYDKDSGELTFTVDTPVGEVTVKGTIEDGKMTGVVDMGGEEFKFTAERSEEEGDGKKKGKKKSDEPFQIEFDHITRRIFQLPIEQGSFGRLAVNYKNQLIYARVGESSSIMLFDMQDDEPKEKIVVSGTGNFRLTSDGKQMLVNRNRSGYIVKAAAGQKLDDAVPTRGMTVTIAPREEWQQVFNEAWRIERDFFYDPQMHGVDWPAIRDHYAAMLPDCASRADVGFVIGEMISELNVGHAYYRPGRTGGIRLGRQPRGVAGLRVGAGRRPLPDWHDF